METITIEGFKALTQKIYGRSAEKNFKAWIAEQKATEKRYNLPHKEISFNEWCEIYANLYGLE